MQQPADDDFILLLFKAVVNDVLSNGEDPATRNDMVPRWTELREVEQ
jgi:hypothetical protein